MKTKSVLVPSSTSAEFQIGNNLFPSITHSTLVFMVPDRDKEVDRGWVIYDAFLQAINLKVM